MDIKDCYEILEIHPQADEEAVRRAYRDLASVWHPDRFEGNERLKSKAEAKIKEINEAYQTLMTCRSKPADAPRQRQASGSREERQGPSESAAAPGGVSRLEALVEVGTGAFLTACQRLSRKVRGWLESAGTAETGESPVPRTGTCRGKCPGGPGPGRGRGAGKRMRHGGGR